MQIITYNTLPHNKNIYEAFERESYDLACYLCIEEIANNPANSYAWYYKGKCEYELGNCHDAIICFKRAISIDPDATLFRANLGLAYEKSKNRINALNSYLDEVRRFPDSLFGWQVFVPFLVNNRRFSLAKKICDAMVANNTMNYEFLAEEYADSLYHAGSLQEELVLYEKLKSIRFYPEWAKRNHYLVMKDLNLYHD